MKKNIFEDIGFSLETSKDLELRVKLIDGIIKTVSTLGYTQKELQIILEQPQSEISFLLNGKISRFSSDKLIKFLTKLNAKVKVEVTIPKRKIAV